MRSIGRFSAARIAYLAVVSTALVVVSVRTFTGGGNSERLTVPPAATDAAVTDSSVTTSMDSPTTDAPGTTPTPGTRAPAGRPGRQGTSSVMVPVPGTVPAVTTTVNSVAPTTSYQTSQTVAPSTTRAPGPNTTSTTLYPPNAIVMVIPYGTYARIQQGDDVEDVMPAVLNAKVGQTLYLVNKDEYAHLYGNVAVNPYKTAVYPFTYAGDQLGICTVGPSRVITFRVTN